MADPAHERQRRTFETTAEQYDRYRPAYPAAVFDDIRTYADLAADDDRILEIGCGSGRATTHIAAWPHRITALEPAEAMADIARARVANHDNVEIIVTTFESWPIERTTFGLVLCAQAYHWLDPVTRADRIADALYAHGTAAILGNLQVTPPQARPFAERVQSVYLEHAPHLAHEGPFRAPGELPAHPLDGSQRFVDLEIRVHEWQWTLDTSSYIGLLGTHSNHAALDDHVRKRLHDGIGKLIDEEFGGEVTEFYIAAAALARRS